MPSELVRKQHEFTRMMALLLLQAEAMGYMVALSDAYRDPRVPYGHPRSLHRLRLAVDLILRDADGTYLTKTADYKPLGEWWESIGGSWGGRFSDGNHFSLAFGGMK